MKQIIRVYIESSLIMLFMALSFSLFGHEGHDHGTEETEQVATMLMSRTEAHNDKFEVLLKFTPNEPGDSLNMFFYVSDYRTNKPIRVESVTLTNLGRTDQRFDVRKVEDGIFQINTIMPDETNYAFRVLVRIEGIDYTFDLNNVDFTHHHTGLSAPHEHSHFWMYLSGVGILLLGLVLGRYTAIRKYNKQVSVAVLLVALPLINQQHVSAHEGHQETPAKLAKSEGNFVELAKESQFLMEVYTDMVGESGYQDGRKLYGTIIPSSGGQSRVVLPQHGRIVQLNATAGQHITQGAVLAVIERSLDPTSEVLLASERNKLTEEVKQLQKEVERLTAIGDIVSKKEMEHAESAYTIAKSNLDLYMSSNKLITIKAAISGVVSAFTYQVGDFVNTGSELLSITNIQKVYIETQAFEKDVAMIGQSRQFMAQCADGNHSTDRIRLLSLGVEFNSANQSQKVLFEVDNSNGDFKLGEFVNVWTFVDSKESGLAVPNSAITELQGRPAVFVKKSAEQFELRFVALGRNNGTVTEIQNGLKDGERFVTEGAYQCKLVYLNN